MRKSNSNSHITLGGVESWGRNDFCADIFNFIIRYQEYTDEVHLFFYILWRNERIQIFQSCPKYPWWFYTRKRIVIRLKNKVHDGENFWLKKKTLQFCNCFSYGLKTLLAECLHEFKFPWASTIRSNTVVGREPSKENLLQHQSFGPVAHRLRVRVRSGHDFCLPSCI